MSVRTPSGTLRRGQSIRSVTYAALAKRARTNATTPVFDTAVKLLSHGVHISDVQRVCAVASAASAADPLADRLGRLGGSDALNMERGFRSMIRLIFPNTLEPYWLELPLTQAYSAVACEAVPIYLIHELLDFVCDFGFIQQHVSLFGEEGLDGLAEFWDHASQCPELAAVARRCNCILCAIAPPLRRRPNIQEPRI